MTSVSQIQDVTMAMLDSGLLMGIVPKEHAMAMGMGINFGMMFALQHPEWAKYMVDNSPFSEGWPEIINKLVELVPIKLQEN